MERAIAEIVHALKELEEFAHLMRWMYMLAGEARESSESI
jgi:hypothetical protein